MWAYADEFKNKIKLKIVEPEKKQVKIRTETISLNDAMKFANAVCSGGQAKMVIQDNMVKVNGEVCTMRGKKLRVGDKVEFDGLAFEIV